MASKITHYLESELHEWLNAPGTFELLDNTILDGLWLWDLENPENEYMSPTFWKTLGFDPSEKKHLASEWLDLIFPEDGELAKARAQQHLENPEYPYDQVVRYHTKSGEPITIRCRGKALLRDGKPYRLFGAHMVVSDRKRNAVETRLAEMMHMSNDAIVSWTEQSGIETWNQGAVQNYGVAEVDALGRNPFEVSGAILPEDWEDIKARLDTGEDWLGEITHITSKGDEVITTTRISTVELDDGRQLYLKISRDETQRIRAQTQNTILLRELKHRVRNLFAVVQSITRLSARAASDIGGFVDTVQGRIAALSAAHTASMAEESLGPVPIDLIVNRVLEPYMSESLLLDPAAEKIILPESALTPFSLLMHELATNALKHGAWSSESGNVRVKWRSETDENGEKYVKFEWTEAAPSLATSTATDKLKSRTGFGTILIDNSAKQLRAKFDRRHNGNTLCITLTFPT